MPTSPDVETIEAFCTHHPLAVPVLRRLGLVAAGPACSLETACDERGIDISMVRSTVTDVEDQVTAAWRLRPVPELLDHILCTYHRPFAHEHADVEASLAAAIADSPAHPWAELERTLAELRTDLELHMTMEEHVLFPWLRDPASSATAPIRAMELEHADTIHLLLSLPIPRSPDPAIAALASRMCEFERWLCEHLHFESNELVPRALHIPPSRG